MFAGPYRDQNDSDDNDDYNSADADEEENRLLQRDNEVAYSQVGHTGGTTPGGDGGFVVVPGGEMQHLTAEMQRTHLSPQKMVAVVEGANAPFLLSSRHGRLMMGKRVSPSP